MHGAVMRPAQQDQVARVGGPAVQPVARVVGMAGPDRLGTPREAATTVAGDQRVTHGRGHHAGAPAGAERQRA
ncbi:MAG: hypothetical protein M3N17_03055, partial [Actinomycetota bacterium]|nr:hypothetical protein [Actinomycetota bacterium]